MLKIECYLDLLLKTTAAVYKRAIFTIQDKAEYVL